jgi:capsular polysaccharide biosynthesis protein
MNLARPVAQTYTVLISRKNTRKWANEEHILRQISLVTPVKIYTGDETLSDTIQLFHGANAVIGYHGAGLANAVFCQNGTKIIEVSVALPSGKRWRSNVEMVTKYGKFQQFQILMPFEKLAEANNKTLEDIKTDLIMTPKVHFDYYVKDLQWVMADDEVLTKIDAAIKK